MQAPRKSPSKDFVDLYEEALSVLVIRFMALPLVGESTLRDIELTESCSRLSAALQAVIAVKQSGGLLEERLLAVTAAYSELNSVVMLCSNDF